MTLLTLDIVHARVRNYFNKAFQDWLRFTVLTILLTPAIILVGITVGFVILTGSSLITTGYLTDMGLEKFIYYFNWALTSAVGIFATQVAWKKRNYMQYLYSTGVTLIFAIFAYFNVPATLINSYAPGPLLFLYIILLFLLLGFATAGTRHYPLTQNLDNYFILGAGGKNYLNYLDRLDWLAGLMITPWVFISSYRDIWNFRDRKMSDKDCWIAAEILMVITPTPPGLTMTEVEEKLNMYDAMAIQRVLGILLENKLLGADERNSVVSYYRDFNADHLLSPSYTNLFMPEF